MKYHLCVLLFILSAFSSFAQKLEYATLLIPDSLKQNANAVVRLDQTDILISSQRDISISHKRIVTVLNEQGINAIGAVEYYDKKTTIKSIEATVLDAFGNEIKKSRKKDFKDENAGQGNTLFSDSRIIYLDFTPTQYPFTIVYECQINSSNTAFIPQWYPISHYFVSVEKSILNVKFSDQLGFKKKEFNFSKFPVEKTIDSSGSLSYMAVNIVAQKQEYGSPEYFNIFPKVMMGLALFHLENVDGNVKNWKEFGQWFSDQILSGTSELPEETKAKIFALVGNEHDPIQKAKIIYNYVQQKSRYVSIQVGIGGLKPMPAKDVDRLGYGDCKALTNYTKALLDLVGVTSYYTILYGSANKRDIQSDFVSMQGNHVLLTIPDGNSYFWLECTSPDGPFGYQANFTDDRQALMVTPEGGEIIRTKNYQDKDNTQITTGGYSLNENGDFSAQIALVSKGSQYSKYYLENSPPTDKESYYKAYLNNINNLKIEKVTFVNDKVTVNFIENLTLSAIKYAAISAEKMIFVVNAFNQTKGNIKRIRNRRLPFEIQRGYFDHDEIAVALPPGYKVEVVPKNCELTCKFGEYKTEMVDMGNTNWIYKRTLLIKKGYYENTDYEDYRIFIDQISRNDNAKMILTRKL
ncbi:MAG: DUF3857 domain-containing protein [Burkholderiales bacterium]|nr:DUF3857 domain-containing protein [Flavobacterium sp.]